MELIQKFKNYLLSQKNAPSKATVKNYLADIHHFISWVEEQYQKAFAPQDVTIQIIEAFKEAKKPVLSQSSIDRHISSLRKFFVFLKLDGQIGHSPFEEAPSTQEVQAKIDPWHLHDFKNYLYVYNASNLTIKNYLIDVKQFLTWAEQVLGTKDAFMVSDKDVLKRVDTSLVEEYKTRLLEQHVFSASSINRKLSSLRKYLSWAAELGYTASKVDLGFNIQESGIKGQAEGWQEGRVPADAQRNEAERASAGGNSLTGPRMMNAIKDRDRTSASLHNKNQPQKYSKIPPIRLFQKTVKAGTFALDLLISRPIAHLLSTAEHKKWQLQGKPLFVKAPIHLISQSKRFIPHVKNISKELYAPLSISITHLPWYRKALHHIRYTRPAWYRRYHQMALAHYFNWAVLIIFSTAIGFGMYTSFMQKPTKSLAALPNGPLRVLSFQGRLTDANDNPITSPTYVRFMIYNDATATGSASQWEELDKVTPDSDGIFSLLLGSNGSGGQAPVCSTTPATGACGIPQSLFANNNALWLGVTVGNTSELTPREQIATVAFASNAETLQGLPPITQSGAGTQNVVLALNSSGNLAIGASTTFQSTSGQFALSGNTLALNTNAGTNGNITLAPDGLGFVDIQKPIQNSTNNNNIPSATGAVEVDDLFAILATSSGQSAFTLNQNGTGPLISASTSGTAKFTVDNAGNTYATAFYPGLGSSYVINNTTSNLNALTLAGNLTVSGTVASDLTPSVTNTYSLGSSSNEWLSLYAQNIYSNGQLLANFWQRNNGVVSPLSITDDLAVGGTSTGSAKFQVYGNTGNATTSGNLTFTGTGSLIQTTSNQMLTIGGNTTGNITLSPLNGTGILYVNGAAETVGNGANYTIQTTGNSALSLLSAGSGNIILGQNAGTGTVLVQPNAGGQAALIVNKQGANGDILTASASGTTQLRVSNAGGIYGRTFYDLDNASYFLDPASVNTSLAVAGSVGIGTSSVLPSIGLDIQQYSPNAADLLVNQLASGQDIFTASASGTPKFTITYNGNINTTGTITGLTGITSSGTIDFTGLSTNGVLQTSGGNGTLTVAAVNLGTEVTGVLPLANGGTGANLTANLGGIVYSGSSSMQILAPAASAGQCLISGGSAAPSWASCSTGGAGSYWSLNNGALFPVNTTLDLFVGGTATSSAKFAVLNMNSGTPTASISATATGTGLALGGDGSIQSLINSPLTLGGNTTGSIILAPQNGTGTVSIHGTALDTNASTFALLGSASTINIGAAAGTVNLQGSSLDSTQSTVNLFGTPATINLGGYAHSLAIQTNTTIGTSSANTLTVNSQINSNLIPYTASGNTSSYSLGDPTHMWQNIYAANIYAPTSGGTNGFWSLANNVIYPANYTADDLAIGGSATSSATFQVFAGTVGSTTGGTASTSGNLVFHGTGAAINLLNGNGLNINESVGGDSGLARIVTISNSGDLSLNGNLTVTGGNIYSTAATNNIFTSSAGTINLGKATTTINLPGSLTLGTGPTNTINVNGEIASNVIPFLDNQYALGNSANEWSAIYTHNLYLPATGGTDGYWTLSNQVLSPTNNSDLAIGGSATSSAKFQIFAYNVNGEPAGTASTSGQLTFSTSSQVNLLNNAGLGFYNSVGGDTGITTANPALFISNAGHIGIGTTTPSNPLQIANNGTGLYMGDGTNTAANLSINNRALLGYDGSYANFQSGSGHGLKLGVNATSFGGGTTVLTLSSAGFAGIGTTSMGNAALAVNQTNTSGLGDIFTASASGTPEFTIANDGSIKNSLVPNLIGATGIDTLYNLGASNAEWDTLYVRQIVTPSNGGIAGYWQLTNTGVLVPANTTNDLTVGLNGTITNLNAQATSSANFHVFATTGTASTAANLTFTGINASSAPAVNLLNNSSLGFYNSVGGDSGITTSNPALYIANTGKIGIGTNSPIGKLGVSGSDSSGDGLGAGISLSNTSSGGGNWYFRAGASGTNTAAGGFSIANDTNYWLNITSAGKFGIGPNMSNPQGILDVANNPTNLPSDLTLAQTSGTNIIPNPSFEGASTTSWTFSQGGTSGTMAATTSASMFGSNSLLVTTGSSWTSGYASVSASPSTTYTLSAWVKTSAANNAELEIYDNGTSVQTFSAYHPGDGTWHRLTVTATTGSSTTTVRAFVVNNGASSTTAYYDGIQLEKGSSATPYIDGSLGPGYAWTGTPNNSSSVRQTGSAFAYNTINSAQGIGAASLGLAPTLQLDQNGTGDLMTASASGVTQFRETNTGALYTRSFYDLDNPSYYLDPASTNVSLDVAGSVVIGATSNLVSGIPLYVAQTQSNASAPYTDANTGVYVKNTTAGAYATIKLYGTPTSTVSNNAIVFGGSSASDILQIEPRYTTTAGTGINILGSGNVGIGTTSPATPLEVEGTIQSSQTSVSSWAAGMLSLSDTSSGKQWYIMNRGANDTGNTNKLLFQYYNGAGAYTNAMIIDTAGNVGIGTETPGSGVTMTSGLTINSSLGTGAGTAFTISNQGSLDFALNVSQATAGDVQFYDHVSGNWHDDISLNNGNVGIGTSGPQVQLSVNGVARFDQGDTNGGSNDITFGSNSGEGIGSKRTSGGDQYDIEFHVGSLGKAGWIRNNGQWDFYGTSQSPIVQVGCNDTTNGTFYAIYTCASNYTTGTWSSSDERVKTDITPITPADAIAKVMQLQGVNFVFDNTKTPGFTQFQFPQGPQIGFIAQQVQQILPQVVVGNPTDPNPMGLNYGALTGIIVPAVQYQQSEIASNSALLANLSLTGTGNISLQLATPSADFTVPSYYSLSDALGNPISQMGALAEFVVGNLRAGSIQAQQTITNTLAVATDNVSIAGQSLADYILSVVKNAGINTIAVSQSGTMQTNVISPLASGSAIAIRFNNSKIEIAKDATGSAVASIDNQGNATFSGTLNSQNLAVNGDATVSGTLHANRIEANTIEGLAAVVSTLSAQNVTIINNNYTATPAATTNTLATATGSGNLSSTTSGSLAYAAPTSGSYANIASFSGYLSYVPSLQATTGLFQQGLVSFGPTSLSDTSIQGQLSIGSQLILADNSLNVLGSDFAIQPLRQSGVNFEGGLVAINTNGDLTVNGNAVFNHNLAINTLSPIPGHDLQINLSNGAATGSAQPQLKINNASGSAVFAINQMGDLMASGAANISKLNFNLVQPAMAVSDTEVVATGSAGTATIKAFQKEVTIDDKNVTDKSLIYITPVGTDQTPYLERQVGGTSFTVGLPISTPNDVNFNWLIVN